MSLSLIDEAQYLQHFNFQYLSSNRDSLTDFDHTYGVVVFLALDVFAHAFGVFPYSTNGPTIPDAFLINKGKNSVFHVPFEPI